MKKFALRYNADTALYWLFEYGLTAGDFKLLAKFSSMEEADIYLAAAGFEKERRLTLPPCTVKGITYRNVVHQELLPARGYVD